MHRRRHITGVLIAALVLIATACSDDDEASPDPDAGPVPDVIAGDDVGDEINGEEALFPDYIDHALGKTFEPYHLESGGETTPCVQWRLENDEPLYINAVSMANEGGFHHSNWYIVPDDHFGDDYDDGYFECAERGWSEQTAAIAGTVLFAQSTQAYTEVQQFPQGVVTKIPPNHMVVADLHFLNTGSQDLETRMRLELAQLHPADVDTVATPFQLIYRDLDIAPQGESRFETECDIAEAGQPFMDTSDGVFEDLELYYVLPHYHDLGNHFDLHIVGGPNDGQQIFELTGFNAEANGQTFHPPVDMTGARGLRFSCGFDNPRDESVGWGIGDQEMCTMLGFSNSEAIFRVGVEDGDTTSQQTRDGIIHKEGECSSLIVPRADAQSMPTDDEIDADLYIPDSGTEDHFAPERECVDTPAGAQPMREATLSNINEDIFEVGCSFSACHGSGGAGAGLALAGDDLHAGLMDHQVATPTELPLVDPGNAEGSWLYRVMSECAPETEMGPASFMPRNSPTLMDPELVAMVRDWINDGAPDN